MQSAAFREFEGKELSRLRRWLPFLRRPQLRARLRLAWRAREEAAREAALSSTGSREPRRSTIKNTSPAVAQAFLELDEKECGKKSLATSTCTNTAMNTPFSFEEDENNVPVIDLATRVKRAMRNHDEVSSENEKIGTANFENGKFTRKFHNCRMQMDAGLHTMDVNADVSNLMKSQLGEMQKRKPVRIVHKGAGQMYSERHLKKQSILITRSPKVTRKDIELKTQYYNQLFQEDSKICHETSNNDESNSVPFHNEIQTGQDKKHNISEQDEVCEAAEGDSGLCEVARLCGDVTEDEDFKRETSQDRKNQGYQKDTILQATEMIPGGFFEKQMRCTDREHTQAPWDTCETLIGPDQDSCNYFLHGQCAETCNADDSNMDIDSQSSNFSTTDSDSHTEDVREVDKENQGLEEFKEIKEHMDDWVPWENETYEVEHDVIQTGQDKKHNISEQDEVCEAAEGDSGLLQVARHCGDVTEDEDFKRETSQDRKNQGYQKDTILQATEMIPGGFFEKQMRCTDREHTQAPWDTCETLIGPDQDSCNYFLHGQCAETCNADDSNMDIDSQSSNFSTTDSDSHVEDVREVDKENQGLEEFKEIKEHMDDWVPWENETHEVEHDVQWQKLDEGKNEWRILIDLFSDVKSVHTATDPKNMNSCSNESSTSAYESEEEQTEENPGALELLWDVAETETT